MLSVLGFGRTSLFKVILDGSNRRQIQWKAIWAAGVATSAVIREMVIVNDALADATSAAADTISRALFSANVDKGANDTLEVTWNHALLGAQRE